MNNILYLIIVILFLILSGQTWSQSIYPEIESAPKDTIISQPGFFSWNEYTVIKSVNGRSLPVLKYQQILDHSNVDFSDQPESLILINIDSTDTDRTNQFTYHIAISQDTILVTAPSEEIMEKALKRLHKMKMDTGKDSPDYGLIYLRCGLYLTNLTNNF